MLLPPIVAYGDIGMPKCFYIFNFFVFLYNLDKNILDGVEVLIRNLCVADAGRHVR